MKSANEYGRPSSPAQIALWGEEPSSHGSGRSGRPGSAVSRRERVALGNRVLEVGEQLGELLREVVGRALAAVALKRVRRGRVGAGRPAEPEVDPPRVQPGEHAERLGHLERAVVREHHAAAADADALGGGGDRPDQHLGARCWRASACRGARPPSSGGSRGGRRGGRGRACCAAPGRRTCPPRSATGRAR